jgi:hypothetical protein
LPEARLGTGAQARDVLVVPDDHDDGHSEGRDGGRA